MDEKNLKKAKPSRRRKRSETDSAPIEGSESDLIEHVLEHISSPFRWELLDEIATKKVPPSTDNRSNEKLR